MQGTPPTSGRSVGIDLGTTNSAIAAVIGGKPCIIKNGKGKTTTPSVVTYKGERGETVLVGEEAVAESGKEESCTFSSVKRVIGRKRQDAKDLVADPEMLSALVEGEGGLIELRARFSEQHLKPEQVEDAATKLTCGG
eukprot:2377500-Rhodomonas_salina.1